MRVAPVAARSVLPLLDALTLELAEGGYGESETFGYSVDQLETGGVHLLGAWVGDTVVGVGGIELAGDGTAELKRFYVSPAHRGSGAASAILTDLLTHAAAHGAHVVRLETGNRQAAAIRFYARHGFAEIPRFGPYVDSATSVCMAVTVRPTSTPEVPG